MVNWQFGETFISVLQKERDRKQEQEKYAQTVAFQERQYDLLNIKNLFSQDYNERRLAETERHNRAIENEKLNKTEKIPNILLPELSDKEADYYGTRTEKPMQTTTTQTGEMEDIVLGDIGYNYQISKKDYKPKETNVNVTIPTASYIPTKDLETTWSKLKDLNKLDKNWESLDEEDRYIADEKGDQITYEGKGGYQKLKITKKKLENIVQVETDDRAKKFNSEYKGFQQIYFDLLRDSKLKSAQDKSKYIFEKMYGAPEDVIREMINLITKRVY